MEGAQVQRLSVLPEPVALFCPLYQLLLPLLNHGRFLLLLLLIRFRMLSLIICLRSAIAFQM